MTINLRLGAIQMFLGTVLSMSSAIAAVKGPGMIKCYGSTAYDYQFEIYFQNGNLASAPIFLAFYKEDYAGGFRYIATADDLKMQMMGRTFTIKGNGKLLQDSNITADPATKTPFEFNMTIVTDKGAYIPEGKVNAVFPNSRKDDVIGGECFLSGSMRDAFRNL